MLGNMEESDGHWVWGFYQWGDQQALELKIT